MRARVLVATGVLFLLPGVVGFTGSSWGAGALADGLLGPGERPRRLESFGLSRPIRSDEWALTLPMARAQQLETPRFPAVSLALGIGHLQRNPAGVPVLDWGMVFRPLLWPLLLGSAWSHGVMWFLRLALLALGLLGWIAAVGARTRAEVAQEGPRTLVASLSALAILFSSGFTWWLSTPFAEMAAFVGLAVGAYHRHSVAMTAARRLGWFALAAWLCTCAFFFLYPPIWAPMLWILCAAALDVSWRRAGALWQALRGALPILAAIAAGILLSIAYYSPYLVLIADTVYPGQRVAVAGTAWWGRWLDLVWPSLETLAPYRHGELYVGTIPGMNVCEASAVEATPLLLLAGLAVADRTFRTAARRALGGSAASAASWLVLAAWLVLPLPGAVGWATLLRWSPSGRVWVPFGLLTAVLVAAALGELAALNREQIRPRVAVLVGAVILGASLLPAPALVVPLKGEEFWLHWTKAGLTSALALAGLAAVRTRWGVPVLAASWAVPLVASNLAVNPLLWSRDLFRRGSGHAVVEEALREAPGRLLDYATHPVDILASYGWPVLAGVQVAPNLSLFRFLSQEVPGLEQAIYNRYANVIYLPRLEPAKLLQPDTFSLGISPCSRRLEALAVNHMLVSPAVSVPVECERAFVVRKVGELRLWSRTRPVTWVGVARGEVRSALDFDWSAGGGGERARVLSGRDRVSIEVPAERGARYAMAINLSLVDGASCTNADLDALDTHVVVVPRGEAPARCELKFLGTFGALRRLWNARAGSSSRPAWATVQ